MAGYVLPLNIRDWGLPARVCNASAAMDDFLASDWIAHLDASMGKLKTVRALQSWLHKHQNIQDVIFSYLLE